MTWKSAAKPVSCIKLAAVSDTHLSISEILRLNCRLIGVLMSLVALPTVTVVRDMIPGVRWGFMAIGAAPFAFYMASGGTVSRDRIVYSATQFDRARTVVQIMLIIAVTVLTLEVLLLDV